MNFITNVSGDFKLRWTVWDLCKCRRYKSWHRYGSYYNAARRHIEWEVCWSNPSSLGLSILMLCDRCAVIWRLENEKMFRVYGIVRVVLLVLLSSWSIVSIDSFDSCNVLIEHAPLYDLVVSCWSRFDVQFLLYFNSYCKIFEVKLKRLCVNDQQNDLCVMKWRNQPHRQHAPNFVIWTNFHIIKFCLHPYFYEWLLHNLPFKHFLKRNHSHHDLKQINWCNHPRLSPQSNSNASEFIFATHAHSFNHSSVRQK